MKKRVLGGMLAAGLLTLAASPAMASVTSPDGGATAWISAATANRVFIKDSKGDDRSVFANVNSTSYRLNNHSGVGTTVGKTYTFKVTAVRGCTDIPLATDSCSNWGS